MNKRIALGAFLIVLIGMLSACDALTGNTVAKADKDTAKKTISKDSKSASKQSANKESKSPAKKSSSPKKEATAKNAAKKSTGGKASLAQPNQKAVKTSASATPSKKSSSSKSSGNSIKKENLPPQLDAPDVAILQDSGLNNNLIDLFSVAKDDQLSSSKLSFSLSSQSNPSVVSCSIDFGRYIDCTPQDGKIGYSQLKVAVSDGKLSYSDLLVVSVIGKEAPEEIQQENEEENEGNSTNSPPVISPISDQTASVGQPFVLNTHPGDSDNDILSISDNSPLFSISSQGTISFTPAPGQEGTHTITVTVSDGKASVSRTFRMTILPFQQQLVQPAPNNVPIIAPIPNQVSTVGIPFSLQVSASDPDGTPISYFDDASFFTIDRQTGVIAFTPEDDEAGTYAITITASDGKASSQTSFSLRIDPEADDPGQNFQPFIGNIPVQIAWIGEEYAYEVPASDPEGDTLEFSDNTGLFSIDSSTGEIEFTPTIAQQGRHRITVTVSDGINQVSREFSLLVLEKELPPGVPV